MNEPAGRRPVSPRDLSWSEVDPGRHPFDATSASEAVCGLVPARHVPARPAGPAGGHAASAWSQGAGQSWTEEMTRALVQRFGRWAAGWRWATNEGELGGGPVHTWCCPRDSITTPAETLRRVSGALCEWRAWLEELSEHFDRHPLDRARAEDRARVWRRAVTDLVGLVVDRTEAGDVWYGHCKQVLTWYLTRWGVNPRIAGSLVEEAVGGRFESWVDPDPQVVDAVADQLALSVATDRGS